ncbi:MAG: (2Fe-2S)-binding protein [Treponemataceae bacterium]
MKISFMLNEKQQEIEILPHESLVSVLRNHFRLFETKSHCNKGICGSCTVLVNQKAVSACLVPIATIVDSHVITIEHFKTMSEYTSVAQVFEELQVDLCASCMPLIVFVTYEIITKNQSFSPLTIKKHFHSYYPHCIDLQTLINLITTAARNLRRSL